MKKLLIALLAATTALTGVASTGAAAAQPYDHRDNDHRDNNDHRDQHEGNRGHDHGSQHWRYYGGHYGYQGYNGRWRTGERYPHWRDHQYVISDWRAYDLPPPQPGYAYYRDPNGDVVMAAIASGVIGLILGGALADQGHYHY
jgi:Ni/Co efflux regulator RcnB